MRSYVYNDRALRERIADLRQMTGCYTEACERAALMTTNYDDQLRWLMAQREKPRFWFRRQDWPGWQSGYVD